MSTPVPTDTHAIDDRRGHSRDPDHVHARRPDLAEVSNPRRGGRRSASPTGARCLSTAHPLSPTTSTRIRPRVRRGWSRP